MITVRTPDLELLNATQPEGRMSVHVAFPINVHTGSKDSAVVYFEIDPGDRLATHTDSAEEVLYFIQGEAEAYVGDEVVRASAGDIAVVPAMAPHGMRNVGTERLKVVGVFTESRIVSNFEEPLHPVGAAQLEMGAPAPVAAA
jgi:quercetin dioxygenase-like cupin family protein